MWLRVRLTFCQMACWLANCSWLADWPSHKMLTCPSLRIWLWVRFTLCWMACWLAKMQLAGQLADWPSNKMSTWPQPDELPHVKMRLRAILTFGEMRHRVRLTISPIYLPEEVISVKSSKNIFKVHWIFIPQKKNVN